MKVSSINSVAALLVGSVVLAACGGTGDDGAGSLTPFSVTSDINIKYGGTICPVGVVDFVLVTGGTAPYNLFGPLGVSFQSVNPATLAATGVAITRLANENTQFAVVANAPNPAASTVARCYEDAAITVKDQLGREAVTKLTTAASGTS